MKSKKKIIRKNFKKYCEEFKKVNGNALNDVQIQIIAKQYIGEVA